MRWGDVERVEVVMDVLDLRAARDGEAEPAEEVDQLVGGLGQRMAMAQPGPDAGKRDVEIAAGGRAAVRHATWQRRTRPRARSWPH